MARQKEVKSVHEQNAMENITLRAHYDGTRVLLDDEIELPANTKLLVTVIRSPEDVERVSWLNFSAQGLASAYDDDDEPEYPVTLVKERNPEYEPTPVQDAKWRKEHAAQPMAEAAPPEPDPRAGVG